MLNLQKMGFETHLSQGYKSSNAVCQIRLKWDPALLLILNSVALEM